LGILPGFGQESSKLSESQSRCCDPLVVVVKIRDPKQEESRELDSVGRFETRRPWYPAWVEPKHIRARSKDKDSLGFCQVFHKQRT